MYKKISGSAVVFLVLCVDDILLIRNDVFVTPRPERVYGICNRRVAYVHQGLP